jgi:pullulanase
LLTRKERLWWSRTVSLNGFAEFRVAGRKLIDCRLLGFADGAQAINYVTSHAVEGFSNERLFNLLNTAWETERRIRAA